MTAIQLLLLIVVPSASEPIHQMRPNTSACVSKCTTISLKRNQCCELQHCNSAYCANTVE